MASNFVTTINAKSKYDYRKNKAPTVLSVRAKSQEIRKLTFKI